MFPDLEPRYPDPSHCSEVERRGKYFEQLESEGQYYQLIQLTKECLHNSPSSRPTAEQTVCELERTKAENYGNCEDLKEVVKQISKLKSKQIF